ncbi:nitrous oxide reductase accessory protein NosL [Haloarchaeobius amylolyticus]|uniref:nitrous oxide reductase accessory protein NosL n=1 Tax=Haloarchaeobius amylolyticus TaxID=1198296 RepID=UPI0022701A2F|nr:nitrous oxide reductase accessory protein NosL [Haloarchaeobius amylolyticus]
MCQHDGGHHCQHHEQQRQSSAGPTRRAVLATGAAVAATGIAGCLGGSGDGETPAAVAIGDQDACDVCGMVISKHPGPNGQVFWKGEDPEGHDSPFRFDSLKQCLFPHRFEKTDLDWAAAATYVTDYSAVEYTVSQSEGSPYISSHTEPGSFGAAEDMYYVVESDVQGAMGPDFVPFSDQDDADAFADEYGGSVVAFDDISPALVGK